MKRFRLASRAAEFLDCRPLEALWQTWALKRLPMGDPMKFLCNPFRRISRSFMVFLMLLPGNSLAQNLIKLPFPYGPLGLNSLPWVIAKENRLFEKNELSVDMIYVGASAVIVQSMLSGSANLAGFGGPAVITNVLRGGDIIQVAAMAPYFTQSVLVRPEIRELRALQGKKIGITRFGSVTDFAIRTLLERYNIKDVNVLQMGGFPEAVAGLSRGVIDGAVLSPPHGFRMVKEGFRELVTPKDLRASGSGFLTQGIVARRSFAVSHRDVVLRLIKATLEATRQAVINEEATKRVISKYLGVNDPDLLRQSYLYVTETFVREPYVPEATMQSMVQRMVQVDMIDAKSAQSTPTSAYYDNSFVNELKQSGFLDAVWK
jgi:ABC-type nitrate/sulfonate/bicarbonate transport system substrate-binding protein